MFRNDFHIKILELRIAFSRFDKSSSASLTARQDVNFIVGVDEPTALKDLTPRARIGGWQKYTNQFSLNTTMSVTSEGRNCAAPLKVFLQNGMEDNLSPIDISLDFALIENTDDISQSVSNLKMGIIFKNT